MKVREFEDAVLRIEEVVIRIRAPMNQEVEDYDFIRQTGLNMSVKDWIGGRLSPRLGDLEVAIIDGHFQQPHGKTTMRTLRTSYTR